LILTRELVSKMPSFIDQLIKADKAR